ncbi:MAG TPA: hypothetical protein PKE00_12825, partial [Planctomycetota bacterium]|nr:hypothetical protein [Planctomycetota bacterium]
LTQARQDPSSAIDTSTRVTTIRRGDRPMWEAVEETSKPRDDTKRGGLRKNATPIGATPEGATQGAGSTQDTPNDTTPTQQPNNTESPSGTQGTSPNASQQAPKQGDSAEKNAASKEGNSSSK